MLELAALKVHFDISPRGKGKVVVMAVNGIDIHIDKGDALGLVGSRARARRR